MRRLGLFEISSVETGKQTTGEIWLLGSVLIPAGILQHEFVMATVDELAYFQTLLSNSDESIKRQAVALLGYGTLGHEKGDWRCL